MFRRYEAGEKAIEICRDFKVSRTIFYKWLKRHREALTDDKRRAL
jgi:transposase-like protein